MEHKIQVQIENYDAESLCNQGLYVSATNIRTGEVCHDLAKAQPNFKLQALASPDYEFYTMITLDRNRVKGLLKGVI